MKLFMTHLAFAIFGLAPSLHAGNEVGHGGGPHSKKAQPFPKPALMRQAMEQAKAETMKSGLPAPFTYAIADEVDALLKDPDHLLLYIPSEVLVVGHDYRTVSKLEV